MTIRDIIIKNFKHNIGKFKAFFFCATFIVSILFLYATFYYNESIILYTDQTPLRIFMRTSMGALALFGAIFITYANNAFVRSRHKEFGLLMILGMNKRDIDKLIRYESGIISGLALVSGLFIGSILAKLFFLIASSLLNVNHFVFKLTFTPYLMTLSLFAGINMVLYIGLKRYVSKLNLVEMVHHAKEANEVKVKPLYGFIGLIFSLTAFILLYLRVNNILEGSWLVYLGVVLILAGLYLFISHFGGLVTFMRKKAYYRDLVSLSSIRYRFSDYRKVLYLLTLLSALAIMTISLVYSLYMQIDDMVDKFNPFDIQYVALHDQKNLTKDEIGQIIAQNDGQIIQDHTVKFVSTDLYKYYDGRLEKWSSRTTILSESQANKLLDKSIDVADGQVVSIRNKAETDYWNKPGDYLHIYNESDTYKRQIQTETYQVLGNEKFTRLYDLMFVVVLSDGDYSLLKTQEHLKESEIYMYKFEDSDVIQIYNQVFEREYGIKSDDNYIRHKYDKYLKLSSNRVEYLAGISEYGFEFFIVGFVGLIMLVSSGVVLYFKVISDLDETKARYKTIKQIGITRAEIHKSLSKELKPLFIIPMVLGGVLGLGFVSILFVNLAFYKNLLVDTVFIILVYIICQFWFYLMTRRQCLNELM